MAISVGSTFSDRRDADLKWHWLEIISISIFRNCSVLEDAKILVVRMKTKQGRCFFCHNCKSSSFKMSRKHICRCCWCLRSIKGINSGQEKVEVFNPVSKSCELGKWPRLKKYVLSDRLQTPSFWRSTCLHAKHWTCCVLSDEALAGSIQVICQGWQIGGIEISG